MLRRILVLGIVAFVVYLILKPANHKQAVTLERAKEKNIEAVGAIVDYTEQKVDQGEKVYRNTKEKIEVIGEKGKAVKEKLTHKDKKNEK